jgi:uncharacterized protein (TIGR02300 family)
VSAAIDVRGLKRVCASCGIRFYDLNKRPIHCPNCNVEFSGEIKLKTRRGRAAAIEAVAEAPVTAPVANDQFEEVEATENTISLEEVVEDGADDAEEEGIEGGDLETLVDDDDEDELEVEVEVEKE